MQVGSPVPPDRLQFLDDAVPIRGQGRDEPGIRVDDLLEAVPSSWKELTSRTQLEMGSKSRSFWTVIPYSTSLPMTLGSGIEPDQRY